MNDKHPIFILRTKLLIFPQISSWGFLNSTNGKSILSLLKHKTLDSSDSSGSLTLHTWYISNVLKKTARLILLQLREGHDTLLLHIVNGIPCCSNVKPCFLPMGYKIRFSTTENLTYFSFIIPYFFLCLLQNCHFRLLLLDQAQHALISAFLILLFWKLILQISA